MKARMGGSRRLVIAGRRCLALRSPAGAGRGRSRQTPEATVPDLPNPPEIRSRNGVLDAVFLTEPGKVTVATERFTSNVYNDLYIPPTLRVRRGDTLLLRLVNRIGPADVEITGKQPTNIHFHGMDVSPKPPGRQRVHQCQPGQELPVSGRNPERPSAGPALVPLAPARVRRPADPLRPVGHADRRRRSREPLSPSSPDCGSGSWCSRTSTCPAAARRRGPSTASPTRRSAAARASSRSGRSAISAPTASST